jgi:putative ABC transport system permease protein
MTLLLKASQQFFLRHPAQLSLALVGVAAGVAVVTGVALMRDTMIDSLDAAARALAGDNSLRIEAPPGEDLDDAEFTRLVRTPGSPPLIPFLAARLRSNGTILELLGTDPISASAGQTLARHRGAATGLLANPEAVIINQTTAARLGVTVDDALPVTIDGRSESLRVLAVLMGEPWLDNRLLVDLGTAQRLLNSVGKLSWISAPAAARAWLAKQVNDPASADLVVVEAEERRASVERLTAGLRVNLTALSLLALAVGLFVVHSVLSFLLVQRQRQIGLLRALGVTPGRLRVWLLAEVMVLCLIGALLGLALGTELARALLVLIQNPSAELYGMVTGQQILPSRVLYLGILALTLGLAAVSVSGLITAALAIPPGQLSRGASRSSSPARLYGSAAGLALAGLLVLWTTSHLIAALISLFLWLTACAIVVPRLAMALVDGLRRATPSSAFGRAMGMLKASRQRLGPSMAALSLALGLSAGMALMVDGFRAAVDDWVTRLLRADVYLSIQGDSITPAQFDSIRADESTFEAVSSVRQLRRADGTTLVAYDLPPRAREGFEFLAGGQGEDWALFDQGRGVLVSEPLTRQMALSFGDPIDLDTPAGQKSLPVVGIYRDYASDRGQVAVAGPVFRGWFNDSARDSLGLYLAPGRELPDVTALADRLGLAPSRLDLTLRADVRRITLDVFDRTFRITQALSLLVGLIAVVSLISALMALGLERRREYATLRALGLTRRGLARWVLSQTVGLSLIAAVLAVPISALIHAVLSLAVQPRAFGWTIPLEFSTGPWLQLLPIALIAGLLAGALPAWTIGQRPAAQQLKGQR